MNEPETMCSEFEEIGSTLNANLPEIAEFSTLDRDQVVKVVENYLASGQLFRHHIDKYYTLYSEMDEKVKTTFDAMTFVAAKNMINIAVKFLYSPTYSKTENDLIFKLLNDTGEWFCLLTGFEGLAGYIS